MGFFYLLQAATQKLSKRRSLRRMVESRSLLRAHENMTHSCVDNETRETIEKSLNPADVLASTAGQSQHELGVDVMEAAPAWPSLI